MSCGTGMFPETYAGSKVQIVWGDSIIRLCQIIDEVSQNQNARGKVNKTTPSSGLANRNIAEPSYAPGAPIASHEPVGAYWRFESLELIATSAALATRAIATTDRTTRRALGPVSVMSRDHQGAKERQRRKGGGWNWRYGDQNEDTALLIGPAQISHCDHSANSGFEGCTTLRPVADEMATPLPRETHPDRVPSYSYDTSVR